MRLLHGFLIGVLLLPACSSHLVQERESRHLHWGDLESVQFVQGMKGAENIYLPEGSSRVYVSDLGGNLHLLDENEQGELEIRRSLKMGERVFGIAQGRDGYLYVNASDYDEDGWLQRGGEVHRVDQDLQSVSEVTGAYGGINGLTSTPTGDLYFATGNMKMFSPMGAIFVMRFDPSLQEYGEPELLVDNLGSANGLYYSNYYDTVFFSETFNKVATLDPQTHAITEWFGKTKIVEGFDDVCVDSKGRIWVAEPVAGFLKVYERDRLKLTRIQIDGLGVASSCRVRYRQGEETLFISERQIGDKDDGRGLVVIPISQLL